MTAVTVPVTGPATGPDVAEVYALGSNPDESARLRRQSEELKPESVSGVLHAFHLAWRPAKEVARID